MKYCTHCGAQLADEAVICPSCGCSAETETKKAKTTDLKPIAKIFMIIECVLSAFCFLIPLCWTIPMTVIYCRAVKENRPVSIAFKICSLLFVSQIAGILMLVDNDN